MKQTIAGLIVLLASVLFTLEVLAATTPTSTVSETPIPTVETTVAPTLQPTVDLSPTVGVTAINDGGQDNLAIWFLAATVGLLLIIVVAQAWPKKDEEDQS